MYELAYYDSAVQRFNHYTTRTPPTDIRWSVWMSKSHQTLCISLLLLLFLLCYFFRVFHTSVDGLSLESEWPQVSSGFRDSSRYSGRSYICCSLDGLGSSFDFKPFQPPYQAFKDRSKCTSYSWYYCHLHVPLYFLVINIIIIIIDVLQWTPIHERTSSGWARKTYIRVDIGRCLKN